MGSAAIVGLILSIIGAATNYYATDKANDAARKYVALAEEQNSKDHQKLIDNIQKETQNYAADKRQQAQDELATQLEQSYQKPVSESQAIRSEQQTTQGDVSNDYVQAKKQSDERTQKTIGTLANLMGRVNSAGRLRMNEGIRLGDMANENDWLTNKVIGRTRTSQVQAQHALNSYNNLKAVGNGLSAIGSAISMGSGSFFGDAAAKTAASGAGTAVAESGAQLASSYAPAYAASTAVNGASASPALWFNFGNAADVTKAATNNAWMKAFGSGNYGGLFV